MFFRSCLFFIYFLNCVCSYWTVTLLPNKSNTFEVTNRPFSFAYAQVRVVSLICRRRCSNIREWVGGWRAGHGGGPGSAVGGGGVRGGGVRGVGLLHPPPHPLHRHH